jgi:hypothetical protein
MIIITITVQIMVDQQITTTVMTITASTVMITIMSMFMIMGRSTRMTR